MNACKWKRSLATVALLMLLFAPAFSAIQLCHADPGVTVNLSVSSGPIGLIVTVSGTLENPGAGFKIFWQYIRDWDGRYGFLVSGYAEGYNYVANITIPPAAAGDHYVIVEDEKNHATGYAVFTVTPEITVQPSTAPSGAIVNVDGTLINGETVDVKFQDPASGDETLVAKALTDNVTGEFSCSFKVPLAPEGNYTVRAYWNGSLQAEAPFHISYQGIAVGPDKAPPNAVVTVSGGLAINETFTIAFRNSTWSIDVASVQTDESGQFAINVTVPEASSGDYLVVVYNDGVSASANFTILPPAQITASSDAANPNEALPSYSKIIVQGRNFIADENVTIYFESALVKVAEATTDLNGTFTAEFTVPADASAGAQTITAVQDPYNVSASATITVHNVTIKPYAQLYVPGDTIAFYVNSTTPFVVPGEIVVNVFDPNGIPYTLQGYHMSTGYDIVQVKGFYVAPYDRLAFWPDIPKGAPVGVWTWNATFSLQLYPSVQFNTTGVFYVIAEPDLNYILQRLDELEANLVSITTDGLAQINTVLGEVTVKLDILNAQITGVKNGVVEIQTSLGTMTAKLEALDASVASVGEGVATVNTVIGELNVNLADLKANVTGLIINSENKVIVEMQTLLGPVNATLEELGGKVTAINGNVANVLIPGLGEVETLVTDAKGASENASQTVSGMNILIYAVIVLSLVAVAFSVVNFITVRRKLASS